MEESLDLSFDRLRIMIMMMIYILEVLNVEIPFLSHHTSSRAVMLHYVIYLVVSYRIVLYHIVYPVALASFNTTFRIHIT